MVVRNPLELYDAIMDAKSKNDSLNLDDLVIEGDGIKLKCSGAYGVPGKSQAVTYWRTESQVSPNLIGHLLGMLQGRYGVPTQHGYETLEYEIEVGQRVPTYHDGRSTDEQELEPITKTLKMIVTRSSFSREQLRPPRSGMASRIEKSREAHKSESGQ